MKRRRDACKRLKKVAVVILVCGLVAQICLLAAISDRTKQINEVRCKIQTLNAQIDNLEVRMANYKKTSAIQDRAYDLGMRSPTAEQIRVIPVPEAYADTSTHTAEMANAD